MAFKTPLGLPFGAAEGDEAAASPRRFRLRRVDGGSRLRGNDRLQSLSDALVETPGGFRLRKIGGGSALRSGTTLRQSVSDLAVQVVGVPSGEAFGGFTVVIGAVSREMVAVASEESVGLVEHQFGVITRMMVGIASEESVGVPFIDTTTRVEVVSILTAEELGNPSLSLGAVSYALLAITSGEVVGVPPPHALSSLPPLSISSEESFGTPSISLGAVSLSPTGIASEESLGFVGHSVGPISRTLEGVASEEIVSSPTINASALPFVAIGSAEAFGALTPTFGAVTRDLLGIPSEEVVPAPLVRKVFRSRVLPPVKRDIGTVVHEISSEKGIEHPEISGWEATEEAPGGFMTCTGYVSPLTVKNSEVITYGAIWRTYLAETGECIFAGRLLDAQPQSRGNFAVNAKGWGSYASKIVDRLLYQTYALDDWTTADSSPHSYTNNNKHEKINGSAFSGGLNYGDEKQVSTEGASLSYTLTGLDVGETYTVGVRGRKKDVQDGNSKVKIKITVADDVVEREVTNTYDKDDTQEKQIKDNDHLATLSFLANSTTKTITVTTLTMKANDIFVLASIRFGKTADVNSSKIEANIGAARINFKVAKNTRFHGGEASGVVFWAPQNPLSRIAFTYRANRKEAENYQLELCGTTGPSGDLNIIKTWNLTIKDFRNDASVVDVNEERIKIEKTIPHKYDQILLRLKRKEGADTKKATKLKIWLSDVRVNGIAETDDFTTSQVVRDIAARLGADDIMISDNGYNALPMDVQNASFADALTDVSLLVDWRWLFHDYGNGPIMDFQPWTGRRWQVHGADTTLDLVPLERYDKVRVPYRYQGGVRSYLEVSPDKDRDPLLKARLNTYVLELDDPLPDRDTSEILGQHLANYLARKRAAGTATLATVIDERGSTISAHHVHAGDEITFNGVGITLRIKSLRRVNTRVEVTFDEGHAMIDQLLARRTRRLAMGRAANASTLTDIFPDEPVEPATVDVDWKVRENNSGDLVYYATVDWSPIENDVRGNDTVIERYIAQLRPMERATDVVSLPPVGDHKEGEFVYRTSDTSYHQKRNGAWTAVATPRTWTNPAGGANPRYVFPEWNPYAGRVLEEATNSVEDEDGPDAPPETRAHFGQVDRPYRWYYQARVRGKDLMGRKGGWSEWTAPELPMDVDNVGGGTPPAVNNPALDFDRHDKRQHSNPLRAVLEWDEMKWDIPGGPNDSDILGYIVEFRRCKKDGSTWYGDNGLPAKIRRRFIPASYDDDQNDKARAIFHEIKAQGYYQWRIRARAKGGREGPWYGGP